MYVILPQVIYKPHFHYQNFFPLANGVYLIAIINKTLLPYGNNPITNLITEMGVANIVGPGLAPKFVKIWVGEVIAPLLPLVPMALMFPSDFYRTTTLARSLLSCKMNPLA